MLLYYCLMVAEHKRLEDCYHHNYDCKDTYTFQSRPRFTQDAHQFNTLCTYSGSLVHTCMQRANYTINNYTYPTGVSYWLDYKLGYPQKLILIVYRLYQSSLWTIITVITLLTWTGAGPSIRVQWFGCRCHDNLRMRKQREPDNTKHPAPEF